MKRNLLYLFMLVCSLGAFTSCSSDDDDPVVYPIDQDIAGNYIGNLGVAIDGGTPSVVGNQKITIAKSANGDNQIALSIKDFTFLGFNVGDILVDPCTVTAIDGGYSFEGQQTLTLNDPIGTAPVKITGTVKGNVVEITISVDVEALGQTVIATFNGEKMTGNESSAALITNFTFDSDLIAVEPIIDDVNGTIKFRVTDDATSEELSKLIPTITISDNAIISPASGVAQNFSNNNTVKYTVTAEDGTVKTYVASISGTANVLYYDFETWEEQKNDEGESFGFYSPAGGAWDTSNTGVYLIKSMLGGTYPELADTPYAVEKTSDAHLGTGAAKVSTIDSKGGFMGMIPRITAGTMFLGKFDTTYALSNALKCTRFGNIWDKKPIQVTGFYKYTPGDVYYKCTSTTAKDQVEVDDTKTDAFMLSAVLYEVSSDADSEYLDGSNIYTSTDKIVAMAQLSSDQKVDSYTAFTLDLNYLQTYDATKTYRFAIIASSSAEGNSFSGAPGSALYLDDIKIVSE